jgi:hypothetical protein
MRRAILVIALFLGLILITSGSWGQNFTLGLVADGALKANSEAAYDWAEGIFDATVIPIPTSSDDLKKFGVIWWDESNGAAIPDAFLDQNVINAFLGYVEDGGGLLLSNLAFHYIFEMDLQDAEPRYFGANANAVLDWTDIQIFEGQEDHAIFKGLDVEDGIIQYDILGYTGGSDFYDGANADVPLGPEDNGIALAKVIDGQPQVNPLAEYHVGAGTIILIGWVWSSWVINEPLEDIHGPLHANIINYLASRSIFAPVEPTGKLTDTWGSVKVK